MLALIILYPTGAGGIIVLKKKNQEILLDLADLISPISQAWYSGSYPTATNNPMVQFLIKADSLEFSLR